VLRAASFDAQRAGVAAITAKTQEKPFMTTIPPATAKIDAKKR